MDYIEPDLSPRPSLSLLLVLFPLLLLLLSLLSRFNHLPNRQM